MNYQNNNIKKNLRSQLRAKRRSLSLAQQKSAARRLRCQINSSLLLLRAKHIALYASHDGEICPKILMQALWSYKKSCYLPVLHPLKANQLVFCRVDSKTRLKSNRYGIAEPTFKRSIKLSPKRLSLVLLPLVAFDLAGNRLGMGGGYYDRTFSFKGQNESALPRLVGIAHELQKQDKLPTQAWDIPLCGVITDQGIYLA